MTTHGLLGTAERSRQSSVWIGFATSTAGPGADRLLLVARVAIEPLAMSEDQEPDCLWHK